MNISIKIYYLLFVIDGFKLPEGPVMNYPGGLIEEVKMSIFEGADKYKAHMMNNILKVFPNSLKAGFGNMPTVYLIYIINYNIIKDKLAYETVKIDEAKIWNINSSGVIKVPGKEDTS